MIANQEFIQLLQFLELTPPKKHQLNTCSVNLQQASPTAQHLPHQHDGGEEEDTEMKMVEEEDLEKDLSVRRKRNTGSQSSVERLLQQNYTEEGRKSKHISNINNSELRTSVVDGFNWFSLNSSSDVWNDWNNLELHSWLEEYTSFINR